MRNALHRANRPPAPEPAPTPAPARKAPTPPPPEPAPRAPRAPALTLHRLEILRAALETILADAGTPAPTAMRIPLTRAQLRTAFEARLWLLEQIRRRRARRPQMSLEVTIRQ